MSHVAMIKVVIKDLDALKRACINLGLVFNEGKKTYKWYGSHVGDWEIPNGFEVSDMGKCDHAISVKGNSNAYEIGVCTRRDEQKGYCLLWDFWSGGFGLERVVGKNCENLTTEYAKEVVRGQAKKMTAYGYGMSETVNKLGETVITLRKY